MTLKSRRELPWLTYPRPMYVTRQINAHRQSGGSGVTFGNASRSFDGASKIAIGSIQSSDGLCLNGSAFSLCAWVKPDLTASDAAARIIDKSTAGNASGGYALWYHDGTFNDAGKVAAGVNSDTTVSNSVVLSSGQWHHIVLSVSALGSTTMYIDGSSVSITDNTLDKPPSTTADLNIGAWSSDFTRSPDAEIADVRIYSREITSGEAANLAAGTNISDAHLEGWWITDSDDVLDYSGNGNDGTNNGTTYSTDGPLD